MRFALALVAVVGSFGILAAQTPDTVYLEELTWVEVRDAVQAGTTTIIIPTGGTEQNGPHVILGKHNHIVRHTAEEIAKRLGDTLVAPVLSYVPEGDTGAEPTGHMRFAGTLSVPEPVFEAVLEAAVMSYRTHGFRRIYLLGDSGGNQEVQARVAERLHGDGVQVLHVADYYAANGQVEWLRGQGYSDEEIGYHAGIRDTSELMAVHGEGVRADPVLRPPRPYVDASGARDKASAEIGRKMLELKIEAALRQIRGAEGS